MEAASSQLKNITQEKTAAESIRSVRQQPKALSKNRTQSRRTTIRPTEGPPVACHYCGNEHPPPKENCAAWGKSCLSCGGRNHFARVCRKTKRAAIHAIQENVTPDEEDEEEDHDEDIEYITSVTLVPDQVHAVTAHNNAFANEIYAELIIANQRIKFQIDCGATINILPERYVKDQKLKPTTKKLRMWNHSEVTPLGTTRAVTKNLQNNRRYSVEFIVV